MVKESARCRDENLEPSEQHLLLWWHWYAAVDNTTAQWQVPAVCCGALRDLHRKFARWR